VPDKELKLVLKLVPKWVTKFATKLVTKLASNRSVASPALCKSPAIAHE